MSTQPHVTNGSLIQDWVIGMGALFRKLLVHPDETHPAPIENLLARLLQGKLNLAQLESFAISIPGQRLLSTPRGRAEFNLIRAMLYAVYERWDESLQSLTVAQYEPATKVPALVFKATVQESSGQGENLEYCLRGVSSEVQAVRLLFFSVVLINIQSGIQAIDKGDSERLLTVANRINYLDRLAIKWGLVSLTFLNS